MSAAADRRAAQASRPAPSRLGPEEVGVVAGSEAGGTAGTPSTRARPARVVLVSTYDLGRQPFGLASPAAWLRRAGADVACNDLAVGPLNEAAVGTADFVAFHLPMHTATRLVARVLPRVRELNPRARLGCFGLYAAMNEAYLRRLGAEFVLGGEFERALTEWVCGGTAGAAQASPVEAAGPATRTGPAGADSRETRTIPRSPAPAPRAVSLERLAFVTPDRTGLPELSRYARLDPGDGHPLTVGYTEATRGCKHLCRHCPVVPVYQGRFRVVPRDVVLADVRQQVAAGARHITFGDPDFWNGIGHAMPIVRALHDEFPDLTYDVTIKIEHLVDHSGHLATLRDTGCLFVTSAVESVDDRVLRILDKGHTRADFCEVTRLFHESGLALHPTFVAFTPWITPGGYLQLLQAIRDLDLIENLAPVQLAIRLLIPAGSRLLELPEVRAEVGPFDEAALCHPWAHPDPRVDRLQREIEAMVRGATANGETRAAIFERAWAIAQRAAGVESARAGSLPAGAGIEAVGVGAAASSLRHRRSRAANDGLSHAAREPKRAPVPFLTEPWYC